MGLGHELQREAVILHGELGELDVVVAAIGHVLQRPAVILHGHLGNGTKVGAVLVHHFQRAGVFLHGQLGDLDVVGVGLGHVVQSEWVNSVAVVEGHQKAIATYGPVADWDVSAITDMSELLALACRISMRTYPAGAPRASRT